MSTLSAQHSPQGPCRRPRFRQPGWVWATTVQYFTRRRDRRQAEGWRPSTRVHAHESIAVQARTTARALITANGVVPESLNRDRKTERYPTADPTPAQGWQARPDRV